MSKLGDELRVHLKQRRQALSQREITSYSHRICEQAWHIVSEHTHVALYFPLGAEVDTSQLLHRCIASGKSCYVPIVQAHHQMSFAPVNANTQLVSNRYGIQEPDVAVEMHVSANQLDIVIVPLVGFDDYCNRMGMGGGYYDRCFAHRNHPPNAAQPAKPLLVGVAFEVQYAKDIVPQSWDVPLDKIITEQRIVCKE